MDCPTPGCIRPCGHEGACVDGTVNLNVLEERIGVGVPAFMDCPTAGCIRPCGHAGACIDGTADLNVLEERKSVPIIVQGVPVQTRPSIMMPRTSGLRTTKDGDTNGNWIEEWKPNTKLCERCGTKFTLLTRRHHCRACGCCVCNKCSPFRMQLNNPVFKSGSSRGLTSSFAAESFGEADVPVDPLQAHRVCSTCHLSDRLVDGPTPAASFVSAPGSAK